MAEEVEEKKAKKGGNGALMIIIIRDICFIASYRRASGVFDA